MTTDGVSKTPPFGDHVCAKCGDPAQLLHYCEPRPVHYCWKCSPVAATNWKERAEHYRNEAKYMGQSVKHAWGMLAVANNRLAAAGLPKVNSPNEQP